MDEKTTPTGDDMQAESSDNADRTPIEQAVDAARDQANEAADALRRGEFIRDALIDPDANSDDKLIAMLCYISQLIVPLMMPIIVLLSESGRRRPFQRYHALQSLALTLLFAVLGAVVLFGAAIVLFIPILGKLIAMAALCLTPIMVLMVWIAICYYGYQAFQGKRFVIPGLTGFLHDQGWLSE